MQSISSGTTPPYRQKRYGLGLLGFKLLVALWWVSLASALQQFDLPETGWVVAAGFGGFFLVPLAFHLWNERCATRLKQRDVDAAVTAIKKPLRSARQPDGRVVDFDPHYPTISLGGGVVSAVDPRRRLMRLIWPAMIDMQGLPMDETGSAESAIVDVSESVIPGKRRWFWLLPARADDRRIHLTIKVRGEDGKDLVLPFRFRLDDPAAFGWRHTFEQWMREDQRRMTATASAH